MNMPPPRGWYPDPMHRNDLRFWSGVQWTEHVVTNHVQSVDPLQQPARPVQQSTPPASTTNVAAVPEAASPLAAEDVTMPEARTVADSPLRTAAKATTLGIAGLLSGVTPDSGGSRPMPQKAGPAPTQAARTSASPRKDRLLAQEDLDEPVPTFEGWYPDTSTGGKKYWDGSRWSGDTRPPRRPFAAPVGWGPMPYLLLFIIVMFFFLGILDYREKGSFAVAGWTIVVFILALPLAVWLARGKGPTTAEVRQRLAEVKKEARKKRWSANVATFVSGFGGKLKPSSDNSATEAARISALADPATAKSLQSLQNLLYTQVLTDEEFQAAKDRLIGPSPVDRIAQIEQLAELHRQGVLGDLEFSAAKVRILET